MTIWSSLECDYMLCNIQYVTCCYELVITCFTCLFLILYTCDERSIWFSVVSWLIVGKSIWIVEFRMVDWVVGWDKLTGG